MTGSGPLLLLCSSPALDEKAKVTVKRTVDGYASNWICDNVVAGTVLDVLKPSGTFTPKHLDDDFLLFAGGSGITPVLSILKTALHSGQVRSRSSTRTAIPTRSSSATSSLPSPSRTAIA